MTLPLALLIIFSGVMGYFVGKDRATPKEIVCKEQAWGTVRCDVEDAINKEAK